MHLLTIVNLCLWAVLFLAWIPYTAVAGLADPTSVEVQLILAITAALMGVLALVRVRRRRPLLG